MANSLDAQPKAPEFRPPALRAIAVLAWLCLFASHSGCARSVMTIDSARSAFAVGDLTTAKQTLSELAEGRSRYAGAAALDLAIVELAAGNVQESEQRLRSLRDRFDRTPKLSVAAEAASTISDDTARIYRPSGYEEVMIRAMLSICSLATDGTDAESYALQAAVKQDELKQAAEDRGVLSAPDVYQPLALSPYLRGILREATHHDFDDAAKAYQLVSAVRPDFAPAQSDIVRASEGAHSAPGNGVLYVIACVGHGPQRRQTTAPTTSTALSIASSVLNAETNEKETSRGKQVGGVVLPNIAQVKVPTIVVPTSPIAAVGLRVNDQLLGATLTLTDVGQMATQQLEAEMPWTIARAVVRRATKEAAVAKLADTLGLDGSFGSLFHFATASAWAGTENADTRCWGLLPREVQVLRAEFPSGQHEIALQPLGIAGPVAAPVLHHVEIVDGMNTYVIIIAPTEKMHIVNTSSR